MSILSAKILTAVIFIDFLKGRSEMIPYIVLDLVFVEEGFCKSTVIIIRILITFACQRKFIHLYEQMSDVRMTM